MNHSFNEYDPPMIYETMVFEGALHDSMWRYTDRESAWQHHDQVVEQVKQASRFLFVDDEDDEDS